MFKNNGNLDYYNDAVKDARVNTQNEEDQNNSNRKLLLILNLLLISAILGYFIYKNFVSEKETAVMGVNYTVDIREKPTTSEIIDDKSLITKTPVMNTIIENSTKEELSVYLGNIINNSTKKDTSDKDTSYVKALDNELTGATSKKYEPKQHNKELQDILADTDTKGFSETTNVVKIDNKPEIDTELDINELADLVKALLLEEL